MFSSLFQFEFKAAPTSGNKNLRNTGTDVENPLPGPCRLEGPTLSYQSAESCPRRSLLCTSSPGPGASSDRPPAHDRPHVGPHVHPEPTCPESADTKLTELPFFWLLHPG